MQPPNHPHTLQPYSTVTTHTLPYTTTTTTTISPPAPPTNWPPQHRYIKTLPAPHINAFFKQRRLDPQPATSHLKLTITLTRTFQTQKYITHYCALVHFHRPALQLHCRISQRTPCPALIADAAG
ncbi:hypothetical protein T440DRAFT_284573 [Plenodomus tracheiphilus IPT5]|uniref:Uncharacterized protein n=1 Tax=Plenodomus tracheiphilus IPT5 TaxID=1408161 RepID=A0A6A7APU0_9PLEO|nr:hypothetical protein T440DRAFT_284573 [Plenodomus tracheiphilus IPT5]